MARLRRYFVKDVPQHVIQRGNNRQPIFFAPEDYGAFRGWLAELSASCGVAVHAYVLMTNHIHLLATPSAADSLPLLLQALGRRYVGYVNHVYRRTGSLWEGRYRATVVDADPYLMRVMRYIELNPVRARMVVAPDEYPWSSYHYNARGHRDTAVTPHFLYGALGADDHTRRESYRALCTDALDSDDIEAIRTATNGGWALGNDRFRSEIEHASTRRAAPRPKGGTRIKNGGEDESAPSHSNEPGQYVLKV